MLGLPVAAFHHNQPPAILFNRSYDISDLHSQTFRRSPVGTSSRNAERPVKLSANRQA
jgi:hypothetical protein